MLPKERILELEESLILILDLAVEELVLLSGSCELPSGIKFEQFVCDALNKHSKNSDFTEEFQVASSYAFPDISVKVSDCQSFGIEVKTSKNSWKCFGNSIFESTRIEGVEDRVFVIFARYDPKFECRWKKYEDCIDTINITHSPRFQINMDIDIDNEKPVFSRMHTSYTKFYVSPISERMQMVRELKRKELGPDAALWWLPNTEEATELVEERLSIKLYSDLDFELKDKIFNEALVLFPEIYCTNSSKKYTRVMKWLASQYGVVTGSLRDLFSAGGQYSVEFEDKSFYIPKVFEHVYNRRKTISFLLNDINIDKLRDFWFTDKVGIDKEKTAKEVWIDLVTEKSANDLFPYKIWLMEILNKD